jgi:hypothetical protein
MSGFARPSATSSPRTGEAQGERAEPRRLRVGRAARPGAVGDAHEDHGEAVEREGLVERQERRRVAGSPPCSGRRTPPPSGSAMAARSMPRSPPYSSGAVCQAMQQNPRSASGWPSVESSQSSTATTRGSVGWNITLPSRKSPWQSDTRPSSGGRCAVSQSKSASISGIGPEGDARYCRSQRRAAGRSRTPAARSRRGPPPRAGARASRPACRRAPSRGPRSAGGSAASAVSVKTRPSTRSMR